MGQWEGGKGGGLDKLDTSSVSRVEGKPPMNSSTSKSDTMELNKLKAVLEMLTAFGVAEYKTPELELKLHKSSIAIPNEPSKQEISDEDMLFWSVPDVGAALRQASTEIAPLPSQESK